MYEKGIKKERDVNQEGEKGIFVVTFQSVVCYNIKYFFRMVKDAHEKIRI